MNTFETNNMEIEYCDCCKEDLTYCSYTYCKNCGSKVCNMCYSRYYTGELYDRCPCCQDNDDIRTGIVRW